MHGNAANSDGRDADRIWGVLGILLVLAFVAGITVMMLVYPPR
jgi:hypothetical protein